MIGARTLATAVVLLATAGCSLFPSPPPTRYVVLVPVGELPGEARQPAAACSLELGLGPITLPEYLQRSALVSRQETRLVAAETERWAEPLDGAVERVLALDLEHALGIQRSIPYPWYPSDRPDVQVEVDFSRFERDESGRVVADARWRVQRLDGSAAPIEGHSVLSREAPADGAATALALSHVLDDLSREIAAACAPKPAASGAP